MAEKEIKFDVRADDLKRFFAMVMKGTGQRRMERCGSMLVACYDFLRNTFGDERAAEILQQFMDEMKKKTLS